MDLSMLQRAAVMREEEEDTPSQITKRPKLSNFSVASLLASAQRPRSPRENVERREEEEVRDEEEPGVESDEESDVSVDSHGEDEEEAASLLYNSRLNDSSDLEGEAPRLTSSPDHRPVSPPRSSEGVPHPRLAMPTPLLGGRAFPGLPPGVHLPPGMFPPGWPGLLPGHPGGAAAQAAANLHNLFKSGQLQLHHLVSQGRAPPYPINTYQKHTEARSQIKWLLRSRDNALFPRPGSRSNLLAFLS